LLPLRGDCQPDVLRIAPGDLVDRHFRSGHDGAHALEFRVGCAPAQFHLPRALYGCGGDAGVALQPETSGLKNRRNGRADDVLTVLGKVGVTACGKRAKLTAAVAEKGNLEHVDCGGLAR